MSNIFTTIQCQSCGAILQYDGYSDFICCDYCGTRVILESEIQKDIERKRMEEQLKLKKDQEFAEAAQRQADREHREEFERALVLEKEREKIIKEEKLKAFTKRWMIISGVLIFIGLVGFMTLSPVSIFFIFGIVAFVHCVNGRAERKAEISGEISLPRLSNYTALSCNEVKDALQSKGFSNIKCIQLNKLSEYVKDKSTKVQSITIDDKTVHTLRGYRKPNAEIKIMYNYVIKLPSLSRYKESDYSFLAEALERSGFTNIKCEPLNDLVLGILKKPGKIESIEVNNTTIYLERDSSYVPTQYYLPDTKIRIKYHSRSI